MQVPFEAFTIEPAYCEFTYDVSMDPTTSDPLAATIDSISYTITHWTDDFDLADEYTVKISAFIDGVDTGEFIVYKATFEGSNSCETPSNL